MSQVAGIPRAPTTPGRRRLHLGRPACRQGRPSRSPDARISTAAQEGFAKVNTKVEVVVGNSGTGGGFTKYLRDEIDIVDASRTAKPEEESKAKAQGLDWLKFVVGYDGITVVVNPKNDFVKELSVEQLKKLWGPDSAVKTWKDLDPSWPGRPISFYCPDKDSGTFEFFTEAIVGKAKSQRLDVQASSDDNTLVKGVDVQGKKLKFLRRIPVDPMTNSTDWGLRSMQDDATSDSWGGQNVFDVYTKSQDTALDGTKYKDW